MSELALIHYLSLSPPYRLKDSDVTWLYGPLHTSVDAVPPPKVATANERLGLEPLRSLSDSKRTSDAADAVVSKSGGPKRRSSTSRKPAMKTKPILKHRSLSDILLPAGSATSPVLEQLDMDFGTDQSTISIHHARSDSHLVRLNSLNRKKGKRASPIHSPRGSSPERSTQSDSSSSSKKEHRHISFNHRVEQCIAVDSTDEVRRYPSSSLSARTALSSSDDEEEDDEEDDVLTFKSSPRVTTFGKESLTPVGGEWEPHTIARLGPTTLKSTEIYPSPSPVVVYQNYPPGVTNATSGVNNSYGSNSSSSPVGGGAGGGSSTLSSSGSSSTQENQPRSSGPRGGSRRAPYDYASVVAERIGFDAEDEDDFAMGYDYFAGGPEVGIGDEYDMAQYGSTHLIGGSHNNYQSGGSSYLGNGPYGSSTASPTNSNPKDTGSSSSSSSLSTPTGSSPSSTNTLRGPHAPANSSKEAGPPKRSILKNNRSREVSTESTSSVTSTGSSEGGGGGARFGSPTSPSIGSPSTSPPQSPYGSSNSLLGAVVATAVPTRIRPGGPRRVGSDDGSSSQQPQERGRSTGSRSGSRSSSPLERAASADGRRTSSSISPSSSYSPPSPVVSNGGGLGGGAKPISISSSRRVGSYESLNALGGPGVGAGGRPTLGDVVESKEENESGFEVGRQVIIDAGNSNNIYDKTTTGTGGIVPKHTNSSVGVEEDEDDDGVKHFEVVDLPATVPDEEVASWSPTKSSPPKSSTTTTGSTPKTTVTIKAPTPPSSTTSTKKSPPSTIVTPKPSEVPTGPTSPPLIPAPSSSSGLNGTSRPPGTAPRFRQPSPSTTTTSTTDEEGHAVDSPSLLTSLSNSPALDPTDLASTQWSDEPTPSSSSSTPTAGSVPSYARRSLLRAARGGSHSSTSSHGADSITAPSSTTKDDHLLAPSLSNNNTRNSTDSSGRASSAASDGGGDYGFFYEDDGRGGNGNGESGLVGRTLEVAGTARDLLGAISKGLWSLGGRRN